MFGVNEELFLSKSVAVVGSAPSLVGKALGPEIDKHQNVFRFNGALTSDFSDDVGGKSTHICVGLDLAYFSVYPFVGPKGDVVTKDSPNRLQNALILASLHPTSIFLTWPYEQSRSKKNMQHANHQFIKIAAGASRVFTWGKEKDELEVKDNYQGNKIFEELGLSTRLVPGKGMRTGLRTILMLIKSGIKPNIYGFDINPAIDSVRHYYDNYTNDILDNHPAHDFRGEMAALVELSLADLIKVRG